MSLNLMIFCSKLKNGLCKIVAKSQTVTKFNVTKSRLHCISFKLLTRFYSPIFFYFFLVLGQNWTKIIPQLKQVQKHRPKYCSSLNSDPNWKPRTATWSKKVKTMSKIVIQTWVKIWMMSNFWDTFGTL